MKRRTIVKAFGSLATLPLVQARLADDVGTRADLPEPNTANATHPSVIRRVDVGEWQSPLLGWMRGALADPRLDPAWEVWPTPLGNLALLRPGHSYEPYRGKAVETRYYCGYIDVVTGKVELYAGDAEGDNAMQAFADNYPFDADANFARVDDVGHDATRRVVKDRQ